jgi:predicted transposase/invertase (TIGR01784 family)
MHSRFINPYTDYGFKKLFGEEGSKPLLIDFLNELLPAQHHIADLSFYPSERLPETEESRKAIFDIYCRSSSGERFIVEMQKAEQDYFKDRMVFYSTFPIREQAQQGRWDFKLAAVYCIGLLDFEFAPAEGAPQVLTRVQLKDDRNAVFYDKLTYIYLQMPVFTKTEAQLTTRFDKWLYFLKNLENLSQIPAILNEPVFLEGFRRAEIASFNTGELAAYEHSLMVFRDLVNVIDTAQRKGREEGLEQGLEQGLALALSRAIASGMSEADARKILGL